MKRLSQETREQYVERFVRERLEVPRPSDYETQGFGLVRHLQSPSPDYLEEYRDARRRQNDDDKMAAEEAGMTLAEYYRLQRKEAQQEAEIAWEDETGLTAARARKRLEADRAQAVINRAQDEVVAKVAYALWGWNGPVHIDYFGGANDGVAHVSRGAGSFVIVDLETMQGRFAR